MKRVLTIAATMLLLCGTAGAQTDGAAGGGADKVFVKVDTDPEYPGGMEALYQFIAANVQYPADCKAERVQGKVFVSFVIETSGSISDIKVVRDPDPKKRLGQEAVRVVKKMPKWKPGKQNGKKVRVQYTLPFNFTLD